MRKILLFLVSVLGIAETVHAQVPDPGSYSPGQTSQPGAAVTPPGGPFSPMHASSMTNSKGRFLGILHRGQTLPVYQAAPWYLYWPYDAHFLTPAPMTGAYYAPPTGAYPVQPFFPQPAYGYGYAPPYGPGAYAPQAPPAQPPLLNPPATR